MRSPWAIPNDPRIAEVAAESIYRHDEGRNMKTMLVHLNVTVPDSANAENVAAQVRGALEVGIDADHTPDLVHGVSVTLAEEV